MRARLFNLLVGAWIIAFTVLGCAPKDAVVSVPVAGNHECIPASDLPTFLRMKKVPSASAGATELYDLLLDERAAHAKDQESYNSLYGACVK